MMKPRRSTSKAERPMKPQESPFTRQVLSIVCRIPVGRVASYGDIAAATGRPRAYRAVGNIMSTCTRPGVPCHRVIAAGGRLGGFGGNLALKRALLASEGLVVTGTRVKQWKARVWRPAVRHSEGRTRD
jgi:methylated-DNA-[protein]-cysteine S-methyltransferase